MRASGLVAAGVSDRAERGKGHGMLEQAGARVGRAKNGLGHWVGWLFGPCCNRAGAM